MTNPIDNFKLGSSRLCRKRVGVFESLPHPYIIQSFWGDLGGDFAP